MAKIFNQDLAWPKTSLGATSVWFVRRGRSNRLECVVVGAENQSATRIQPEEKEEMKYTAVPNATEITPPGKICLMEDICQSTYQAHQVRTHGIKKGPRIESGCECCL